MYCGGVSELPDTEWQWFRRAVRESLLHPDRFAATLAREHYGLAGLLVAILAGIALSLSVDTLIVAAKGLDPLDLAARLLIDALFLGARLAIVAAVTAAIVAGFTRLVARHELSLDAAFTALAFALTPLAAAPLLALAAVVLPETLPAAGALAAVLALRLVYGLVANLRGLAPLPVALGALVVVGASAPLTLSDQISRVEFAVLAYRPALAPELVAAPSGVVVTGDGYALTLPERWRQVSLGLPGEIGRYETATDVLVVVRAGADPLLTPDTYADKAASEWRRGLDARASSRTIERTRDLLLVDDVHRGTLDGRPELLRQIATVVGTRGWALQFRYIDPDETRALSESAAIAASWHVSGR